MPHPSSDRIRATLEELFAIDPSLRAHAQELEEVVTTLLAARPDVQVNERFVHSLRRDLLERADTRAKSYSFSLTRLLGMKKNPVMFVLPAAALVLVLAVVATTPNLFSSFTKGPASSGAPDFGTGILVTQQGNRAFGDLSSGTVPSTAISARMQGGGAGFGGGGPLALAVGDSSKAMESVAAPYAMKEPASLIAPDIMPVPYERIRYVYNGPELELEDTATVYRRVKRPLNGATLASTLSNARFGPVDLKTFDRLNLQNFTMVQPGDFGYQISVDLNEGFININENYLSWPRPEATCRDEACFERNRVKPEDVPADGVIIAATDAFLAQHGIAKDAYGTPVVDRRWSNIQPLAADSRMIAYTPDVISVIYPVRVEGGIAYDSSGFPYGLSVSYNVRHKRVSGMWNLVAQEYQSSSYDAVTDAKQLLDVVSRGDVYSPPFGQDPNERIKDVELGAPERVLMQTYRAREDGFSDELLVPALRFPVIGSDASTGYRDAVVIPLVKELIHSPGYGGGVITLPVMPMQKAAE